MCRRRHYCQCFPPCELRVEPEVQGGSNWQQCLSFRNKQGDPMLQITLRPHPRELIQEEWEIVLCKAPSNYTMKPLWERLLCGAYNVMWLFVNHPWSSPPPPPTHTHEHQRLASLSSAPPHTYRSTICILILRSQHPPTHIQVNHLHPIGLPKHTYMQGESLTSWGEKSLSG